MASTRNAVITRLKEELDAAIALVVHARESLENELDSEWAQKKLSVDASFLKKLSQLTASFNSLTESKIRLDKAEKAMERDLTPEEEREAVVGYLVGLKPQEAWNIFNDSRRIRTGRGSDDPEDSNKAS
jgi:recombinational DNA repair ATPase RecF